MFTRLIKTLLWSVAFCLSFSVCGMAEAAQGVRVEKDIAYVTDGDAAQKLDLYLPEKPSDTPLPLIVWVHGGGWQAGSKSGCPAVGFVARGYVAASVEYRFSQKAVFPAQIQDCQAAIRWLRANSKKYNIDPEHIGVWGGSAGGHLVALMGTLGGKKAFTPVGGNENQCFWQLAPHIVQFFSRICGRYICAASSTCASFCGAVVETTAS